MASVSTPATWLAGYIADLPTPFDDNDRIDSTAFAGLCERQIEAGASAIVVASVAISLSVRCGNAGILPLPPVTVARLLGQKLSEALGQPIVIDNATGAGGSVDLPAPDASGSIAMAAGAGKVALVTTTSALSGSCPSSGRWGPSTTTTFPAPAASATRP